MIVVFVVARNLNHIVQHKYVFIGIGIVLLFSAGFGFTLLSMSPRMAIKYIECDVFAAQKLAANTVHGRTVFARAYWHSRLTGVLPAR